MSIVGQNIRKLREHKGESQSAFAARFALSRGQIASYEADTSASEPAIGTIIEIVNFFDIDMMAFVSDARFDPAEGKLNGKVNGKVNGKDKINPVSNEEKNLTLTHSQPTRTEIIVATQDPSGNPTYTVVNHKAAANYLSGYQSQEYYESLGVVTLPRALTGSSKQGIFFQISGDSMTPKFHEGDWVACTLLDRSEWHNVRDLDCYVVVSATYGIQFKRVKSRLDGPLRFIRCKSDNRRHRAYNIAEPDLLQLFRFVLHVSPDASNPEDALYQKVDHLEDTTTDLRIMFEQMQERLEELTATKKPTKGHEKAH